MIMKTHSFIFRLLALATVVCAGGSSAHSQFVPVISGGAGALGGVNGGSPNIQTTIMPVIAVPLGTHLLVESRGFIEGLYQQKGRTGPYNGSTFTRLQYLQFDYLVSPKLTIVGGRYLTPFGTYNERLSAIWIPNFQDAPAVSAIGTRTSGSSNGGMVRGALLATQKVQLNYVGYFSAFNQGPKFTAGRTAGYRFDLYFPGQRLEVGTSYNRILQGVHSNNEGMHLWWQPYSVPFNFRSEYAHAAHSDGYWFEGSYRLSQWGGDDSFLGRFEPAFRMQQTFRHSANSPGQSDALPSVGTQQADFGLDYHLPGEGRLNTSYSRSFSSTGNHNIWEMSLTYRLLIPMWGGHSK